MEDLQEYPTTNRCPRQTPRATEVRRGVYVVGFGRYVKIGISTNVYKRVAILQTPEELKIYAILDGWVSQERELHRRFAEYRLRGEWFRHEGELAKWVTQVSTGRSSPNGNGRAKLTENEVEAIRAAKGARQRELAAEYGVSRTQIAHIRAGRNWTRITLKKISA